MHVPLCLCIFINEAHGLFTEVFSSAVIFEVVPFWRHWLGNLCESSWKFISKLHFPFSCRPNAAIILFHLLYGMQLAVLNEVRDSFKFDVKLFSSSTQEKKHQSHLKNTDAFEDLGLYLFSVKSLISKSPVWRIPWTVTKKTHDMWSQFIFNFLTVKNRGAFPIWPCTICPLLHVAFCPDLSLPSLVLPASQT